MDDTIPDFRKRYERRLIEIPPIPSGWSNPHLSEQRSPPFRVVSYNVLSQSFIGSGRYARQKRLWSQFLEEDYRQNQLLAEIKEYGPDIICLQECRKESYWNFWKLQLDAEFGSEFKANVGPGDEDCDHGCATFFRTSRFTLVKRYAIVFRKYGRPIVNAIPANQHLVYLDAVKALLKENVALVTVLRTPRSSALCVANGHIIANNQAPLDKMFQVIKLMEGLEKLGVKSIPIIVAIDLNAEKRSLHYNYMLAKPTDDEQLEIDAMDPHRFLPNNSPSRTLKMRSVIEAVIRGPGEVDVKKATTGSDSLSKAGDYIFYSANDPICALSYLDVVEMHETKKIDRFPSRYYCSDHIAMVADFCLIRPPPDMVLILNKLPEGNDLIT